VVAPGFLENPEVRRWLNGVEPAWTMLDFDSLNALRHEHSASNHAIRLEPDLADAEHRETLHSAGEERAALEAQQTTLLVEMLRQNTQLTETVKAIAERLESLTLEVHKTVVNSRTP